MQFGEARAALRRYSLIDVSGGSIAVHRLVQAVTRDRLAREGQEQKWAETALKLVSDAFPFDASLVRTWSPSARLLPHALAAAGHSERLGVALESASVQFNQVGLYLRNRGQLGEAGRVLKSALSLAEKVHGPGHPKVAIYANNVGATLKAQGDLAGALQLTQRALAISENIYGPSHSKVAIYTNNVGQILKVRGDLVGALRHTRRALAINEQTYGPDHPSVATNANNIGGILKPSGDLAGALQYTLRARYRRKSLWHRPSKRGQGRQQRRPDSTGTGGSGRGPTVHPARTSHRRKGLRS